MVASLNTCDGHCPGCYGQLLLWQGKKYCFGCDLSYGECILCSGVTVHVFDANRNPGFVCFQCHEFTPKEYYDERDNAAALNEK